MNESNVDVVPAPPSAPFRRRLSRAACVTSLLLLLAVTLAYLTRDDRVAAVTVFPPRAWSLPGIAVVWLARRRTRKVALAVAALWLVYLAAMIDQPAALIGMLYRDFPDERWESTPAERRVRIVSLNCGSGSARAIAETAAYEPDIVLLQESPGGTVVAEAARELFGATAGHMSGADAAIIVRGELVPDDSNDRNNLHSVQATVRLDSGARLHVVSLRLEPPLVRLDLWSPDCWRAQTANRQLRRRQLVDVAKCFPPEDSPLPLIVGGDFNAPPGDAVFDLLAPRLSDSFVAAGLGWGNTITNVGPFTRIDQVWISEDLAATTVVARRTLYSDHRLVVADLLLSD
ncbi:MAG: endonuclease/exonuclease/phosphatase family protein [Planctomycetales bacterium]|nr:endonuclease/exonuclease/phosphatase family protein [Planctomycetales bacterium]